MRRSLGYPLKLIANNAGVNGSVVQQKVLESSDPNVGYNASTGDQVYLWQIYTFGLTPVTPKTVSNAVVTSKTSRSKHARLAMQVPSPRFSINIKVSNAGDMRF